MNDCAIIEWNRYSNNQRDWCTLLGLGLPRRFLLKFAEPISNVILCLSHTSKLFSLRGHALNGMHIRKHIQLIRSNRNSTCTHARYFKKIVQINFIRTLINTNGEHIELACFSLSDNRSVVLGSSL